MVIEAKLPMLLVEHQVHYSRCLLKLKIFISIWEIIVTGSPGGSVYQLSIQLNNWMMEQSKIKMIYLFFCKCVHGSGLAMFLSAHFERT